MLKIRLSMGGAKKRPVYKIVVADSRFPRDGRFIEKVGFFNPLLPKAKKERINFEVERIKHWISKGAKPTLRVSRILGEAEIYPMPPKGNNPLKAIPKKDRKKDKSEGAGRTKPAKAEAKKEEPKKVPKSKNQKKNLKRKNQRKKLQKEQNQKQNLKRKNQRRSSKRKNQKLNLKRKSQKQKPPKGAEPKEEVKKEEPKKE